MNELYQSDLKEVVGRYSISTDRNHRYSSFDYCYNYFYRTEDPTKDMEKSCLILGFYLASWGMFRGSSFLLQQSVMHFVPTIEHINSVPKDLWAIDVDTYDRPETVEKIKDQYKSFQESLAVKNKTHLTLVTKALLGVFGYIPAFDLYFCNTFRQLFEERKCGFRVVNKASLACLHEFYMANKAEIDGLSTRIQTKDFHSDKPTGIHYTKAKILDMYGFEKGRPKK